MPTFVLTAPMAAVISDELRYRIARALEEFPELGDRTVTVGLTAMRGVDGLAVPDEMLVRLNVSRRRVPFFTIGHELMHLLQRPGLGIVPAGEVQCDIWTLARSELFADEKPCYLDVACGQRAWPRHAQAVRRLCQDALNVRRRDRRYIVWLKKQLRDHFDKPTTLPLFDALSVTP
jgi:hypothetical protein